MIAMLWVWVLVLAVFVAMLFCGLATEHEQAEKRLLAEVEKRGFLYQELAKRLDALTKRLDAADSRDRENGQAIYEIGKLVWLLKQLRDSATEDATFEMQRKLKELRL